MTNSGPGHPKISPVDVIIPVYGAARELDSCLRSVIRHTRRPPHRLILVIDGPQSPEVEDVISRNCGTGDDDTQIIRHEDRRGFVAAANSGMTFSDRDVVLLNSDTEVTARWIEKLTAAAYSAPRIATVTPLSNNATICSLPEFLEENLLPAGISCDELGELIEESSHRLYPRLPTGVGVCLFIRREVLDEIGLFSEEDFGLGYGEENEFCIRATRAGFDHLADDATFVYHAGQSSFGSGAARRQRLAMRKLRRLDQSYVPRIAAFIKDDPMADARQKIVERLQARTGSTAAGSDGSGRSILHIVHGWPPFAIGGTEVYANRLARIQRRSHRVSVFSRIADSKRRTSQRLAYSDHGIRVRLLVNNFDQRNPVARNALADRRFESELSTFLDQVQPDLVHVHHLAGHSASLMNTVARRGIPIVYQIQDWWALCARANLWRSDDTMCSGPSVSKCSTCLPMTGLRPRWLLNRLLHQKRSRSLQKALEKASSYVMGSTTIRRWYEEAGILNPRAPIHVLDYGAPTPGPRTAERETIPGRPAIVFGVVGTVMPHKGTLVAAEAFSGLSRNSCVLEVWGDTEADPSYTTRISSLASTNPIDLKGTFDEASRADVFRSFDVLIIPSLGLESFGIVAREAMAAGVPVIASRRGALEELGLDEVCGATFSPGDSSELRAWVERIADKPEIIERWRRKLPITRSAEEHAEDIEQIYGELLGDVG